MFLFGGEVGAVVCGIVFSFDVAVSFCVGVAAAGTGVV